MKFLGIERSFELFCEYAQQVLDVVAIFSCNSFLVIVILVGGKRCHLGSVYGDSNQKQSFLVSLDWAKHSMSAKVSRDSRSGFAIVSYVLREGTLS